jgi:DNA polymerase/3'-5' exonuclease PolX
MSDNPPVPLQDALTVANELIRRLRSGCRRIEIAGSIRRQTPLVHDIEIVALPVLEEGVDLFGNPTGHFFRPLDDLMSGGWIYRKNGPWFKQFEFEGIAVDMFLTTPAKWGVIYMLSTGSSDFSHWLVTPRPAGAMPFGMRCKDGRLWLGGMTIDTPEEADVFKVLGLPVLVPECRTGPQAYQRPVVSSGGVL